MRGLLLALALAGVAAPVPAAALELKPRAEGEGRWFFQGDDALTGSVAGSVEVFHEWGEGQRLVSEFFGRWDEEDEARTHADARDLFYQVIGDTFELRMGMRRVFWGVTESRHLVDVVNQSDFVEDLDGEAKLGQPMANLALIRDVGTFDFFLLPYQRARTFPGPEGRPRFPLELQPGEAQYGRSRGQEHLDAAVRYVGSFGPVDLGVAWFDGTARDPRLVPCLRRGSAFAGTAEGPNCDIFSGIVLPQSPLPEQLVPILQELGLAPSDEEAAQQIAADVRRNLVLVPHYDGLRQLSLDAQVVTGSLALKLEALRREQFGAVTWAAVTGFEYTLGDVAGSGMDVGLLAEYLSDGMPDALARFDDELFFGSRLAWNDVAGSQVLAGAIMDRENFRNRFYGIEASRRLTDDWRVLLETRLFSAVPAESPGAFLAEQDFVTVTLERFF